MLSFKQFDFPPVGQNNTVPFDPSRSTKMFWLYTKKNQLDFGVTLPGLCETTGYSTQMLAFFGILVLEIAPTVYGIAQGLLWQAVAAAILIDIFLAIVAHLWHDKILLAKNQLVITPNAIATQNLRRQIGRYTFYTNFFYFLIFLSGCVKFFFFYIAYLYFDAIAGAILVSYLLGGILHITYTGYFLYTSRFYWFVHNEYKQYLNTNALRYSVNAPSIQPITTDGANVQFNMITKGLHRIFKGTDGTYFFETLGIMTDKELVGFIGAQQNAIARDVIAREGLSQQLLNFNALNAGAVNLGGNPTGVNNAFVNPAVIVPSQNN